MKVDPLKQEQLLAIRRQNGIITGNEWRQYVDINPGDDPELNKYLVLSNLGGMFYQAPADKTNVNNNVQTKEKKSISFDDFDVIYRDLGLKIDKMKVKKTQDAEQRGSNLGDIFSIKPLISPTLSTFLSLQERSKDVESMLESIEKRVLTEDLDSYTIIKEALTRK